MNTVCCSRPPCSWDLHRSPRSPHHSCATSQPPFAFPHRSPSLPRDPPRSPHHPSTRQRLEKQRRNNPLLCKRASRSRIFRHPRRAHQTIPSATRYGRTKRSPSRRRWGHRANSSVKKRSRSKGEIITPNRPSTWMCSRSKDKAGLDKGLLVGSTLVISL